MQQEVCLNDTERQLAQSREQFPTKLYLMLELADNHGLGPNPPVQWLPHGRAFKIHDKIEFMKTVVPHFFKISKIRSFSRQLNLWGFKRMVGGPDIGAWYHAHFLRGAPWEMKKMVRVKIKGSKSKGQEQTQSPGDLDFYSMPPLPSVSPSTSPTPMKKAPWLMQGHPLGSRRVSIEETASSLSIPALTRRVSSPMSSSSIPFLIHVPPGNTLNGCFPAHQPSSAAHESSLESDNFEPLPMTPAPTSCLPIPQESSTSRTTLVVEPLPYESEVPIDEFASYIDSVIQVL